MQHLVTPRPSPVTVVLTKPLDVLVIMEYRLYRPKANRLVYE